MTHRIRSGLFATSAACAVILPGAAYAEEAATGPRVLDEIVVTAERRLSRLEDVPASVVAVRGDDLQRAQVVRFQDLGKIAPGVLVSNTGTVTQPSIRGITSVAVGPGAENNVGIYIDGFIQPDQWMSNQDMVNLESIEILKGPQGTLYGRNATGGAILLRTLEPGAFATRLSASYGTLNDVRVAGYVSLPIVADKLAVSVAGYVRHNDGYLKDINNFANPVFSSLGLASLHRNSNSAPFLNKTVRAKLRWTPNPSVALTLGYNYHYLSDARGIAIASSGESVDPAWAAAVASLGLRQAVGHEQTSVNFRPDQISRGSEVTLLGEFKLTDDLTVTSHTNYIIKKDASNYDFDYTPLPANNGFSPGKKKIFNQAVDAEFKGISNLSLLAGAQYYYDSSFQGPSRYVTYFVVGPNITLNPPFVFYQTQSLKTKYAVSAYVDGTYSIADNLFLTAGVRYTKEKKQIAVFGGLAPNALFNMQGVGYPPSQTFDAFTPRAVVRYQLAPATNIYASYSQGFKSGTFSVTAPANPVEPEKVKAYEVGFKTAQAKFRAEMSAFYYDYRNLQVNAVLAADVGAGRAIGVSTVNAANSKIYGLDASFSYQLTPEFSVYAGAEYLHAKYKDFTTATGYDLTPAGLNLATLPTNPQDLSGTDMIRAPRWSGNFGGAYETMVAGGKFVLSSNASFTSSYIPRDTSIARVVDPVTRATLTASKKARYRIGGYVLVSGEASWTEPGGHTTFAVYVQNLFDKRYRLGYGATNAFNYELLNEPRLVGVRVSYRN